MSELINGLRRKEGLGFRNGELITYASGFEGVGEYSNYFFLVSYVFHLLWTAETNWGEIKLDMRKT